MTPLAIASSTTTATATQGSLRTGSGRALPLERTSVLARVHGPVAAVTVAQRFHNDTPDPIEAVYVFPLPDGASVHRMEFRIENRVVRAIVKEKAEARRDYERARSEGRAATLLEEDQPTLFTLSVANVAPGATIDVELEYQELLAFDDGRFRLVFPMVAPERYRGAEAPSAQEKLPPPRLPSGERPPDVTIEVEVHEGGSARDLRCLSHPVEIIPFEGNSLRVRLAKAAAVANRDFVLEWQAAEEGVRPQVRFERDRKDEPGTFLLTVVPSASASASGQDLELQGSTMKAVKCGNCGGLVTDFSAIREIPGLGPVVPCRYCGAMLAPGTERVTRADRPRDVAILVDRSASMRGALTHARAAVRAILGALGPSDAAQLFAVDHERIPLDGDGSRWLPRSKELGSAADRFLAGIEPRGGTELEAAIERAASLPIREGRARLVVLIGDAAVGNEGRLLRRLPEILGAATRLYVLGVGRGVDRRLVARLSRSTGGASDVVLPWGDPQETLQRFARRVGEAGPVLTDLALWWEGADAADVYPKPLPDLYAGQPIHLLGRFRGAGKSLLALTGRTASGTPFRQELAVELPEASEETPGLTRLWARRHVEALAERVATGSEPGRVAALSGEALALSLRYAIVGPYTSLVAVDSQIAVEKLTLRAGRIEVVSGPDAGKTFQLDRERLVLGRSPGAELRMSDLLVSRQHIEILADAEGFRVRDLASVNSTRIDGNSVREARLRDGMRIEIGNTVMRFDFDPSATFQYLPTRRVEAALPLDSKGAGDESGAADGEGLYGMMPFAEKSGAPDAFAMSRGAPPSASSSMPGRPPAPAAFGAPPAYGAPPGGPPGFGPPAYFDTGAPPPAPSFGPPAGGAVAAASPEPSFDTETAAAVPRALRARASAPSIARAPAAPPAPPPAMSAPAPAMRAPAPAMRAPASDARGSFPAMPPPGPPPLAPRSAMPPASPEMAPPPQAQRASIPQSPIEAPGSEPYPEHELLWLNERIRGELDLVFLVDATGSMGAYIDEVKRRLIELVDALRASPLCRSLRLGLVSYRDHPPQDTTYTSRVVALTSDVSQIRQAAQALSAEGGGDGPEAVTDGLFDVVRLEWRPAAARAVVWFGDAPPHGVEPKDDAFPAGCPCGNHWYAQASSCGEMGISVYAIGCLPGLRSFTGAEAVFRTVARATRGMFLPLREAGLLVPLIAGAAASELDKQRLDEHVADVWQARAQALSATDEPERARWIAEALRARGVRVREMRLTSEAADAAPLCFRDATPADVEGALDRLRLAGRVAA